MLYLCTLWKPLDVDPKLMISNIFLVIVLSIHVSLRFLVFSYSMCLLISLIFVIISSLEKLSTVFYRIPNHIKYTKSYLQILDKYLNCFILFNEVCNEVILRLGNY